MCERDLAIQKFAWELQSNGERRICLQNLANAFFVLHCLSYCLAALPPTAEILNLLEGLRMETDEDEDSTADEGSAPQRSGWIGGSNPKVTGSGVHDEASL